MLLEGKDWREFFDSYKHSAWRLELHPTYTMPQEAEELARFVEGARLPEGHRSGWMDRIEGYVSSGRTIGRVHVVRKPLSDYLRFEFEYYTHHVRAGEDIRILDLTDRPDPGLPDHDFWFFDQSQVVKMLYRPDGTQIGRELVENPDIDEYLRYRDAALDGAIPFGEYWPT